MNTEEGQDCCKCSIPSLGPWRSIFIYLLNMHFLSTNPISVSVCYNKMNIEQAITFTIGYAMRGKFWCAKIFACYKYDRPVLLIHALKPPA